MRLAPTSRRFLLKYFRVDEFDCPCCGLRDMDEHFLKMLDHARLLAGVPFIINSGFRCITHNTKVGGKLTSSHRRGLAVDIKVKDSHTRFKILEALLAVGFIRIGIHDPAFIHVDLDTNKPGEMLWLYG
jgi:uncharacterized protein YcbK (DUF882 family)